MALVEKPLFRNCSPRSTDQFVNQRLQIYRKASLSICALLFHCPRFRPLLGALRTARQYAPRDMFD